MKNSFFRLRRPPAVTNAAAGGASVAAPGMAFFSTTMGTRGSLRVNSPLVPWQARAIEIGATALSADQGATQLATLWTEEPFMKALESNALLQLARHFAFVRVEADREVIRENEFSRFMVVVLDGVITVERSPASGPRQVLAQTRAGDLLGEMSLLDGGPRFSSCRSQTPCMLAVLTAEALDELLAQEPVLAAQAVALLARKLSLQLRALSSRFINVAHT